MLADMRFTLVVVPVAAAVLLVVSGAPAQPASPGIDERLVRLDEGQRNLEKRLDDINRRIDDLRSDMNLRFEDVNRRFEDVNRRFDDINRRMGELHDLIIWGFGVTFAGMFTLIGFVLWDRRTALAPAVRRTEELEERHRRMEAALRDYAARSPDFAETLRRSGLL